MTVFEVITSNKLTFHNIFIRIIILFSMDPLPHDVIGLIFDRINVKDDIRACRLVSKKWKCYTERFVHTIVPTLTGYAYYTEEALSEDRAKEELRVRLAGEIGKYRRFTPKIFRLLPQLKSVVNINSQETSAVPLIVDDFQDIPLLAEQTTSPLLDVYLVKYSRTMEGASSLYSYLEPHIQVDIHNFAKELFAACFQFIRRYHSHSDSRSSGHSELTFSVQCNIPYSTVQGLCEKITFHYLQGVIVISGIDAVNGEFPFMKRFRETDFMIEQLRTVAPYVTGLSTWFFRFESLWDNLLTPSNFLANLTTIRVYRQTFNPRIFSILRESPPVHTLINTYRKGFIDEFWDAINIGVAILKYTRRITEFVPSVKPVNILLPLFRSSLQVMMRMFPNIQSVGILDIAEASSNGGIYFHTSNLSLDGMLEIIEEVRSHKIKQARIYTNRELPALPMYSDLQIEPHIMRDR